MELILEFSKKCLEYFENDFGKLWLNLENFDQIYKKSREIWKNSVEILGKLEGIFEEERKNIKF